MPLLGPHRDGNMQAPSRRPRTVSLEQTSNWGNSSGRGLGTAHLSIVSLHTARAGPLPTASVVRSSPMGPSVQKKPWWGLCVCVGTTSFPAGMQPAQLSARQKAARGEWNMSPGQRAPASELVAEYGRRGTYVSDSSSPCRAGQGGAGETGAQSARAASCPQSLGPGPEALG